MVNQQEFQVVSLRPSHFIAGSVRADNHPIGHVE
jgi:hypothetical protein